MTELILQNAACFEVPCGDHPNQQQRGGRNCNNGRSFGFVECTGHATTVICRGGCRADCWRCGRGFATQAVGSRGNGGRQRLRSGVNLRIRGTLCFRQRRRRSPFNKVPTIFSTSATGSPRIMAAAGVEIDPANFSECRLFRSPVRRPSESAAKGLAGTAIMGEASASSSVPATPPPLFAEAVVVLTAGSAAGLRYPGGRQQRQWRSAAAAERCKFAIRGTRCFRAVEPTQIRCPRYSRRQPPDHRLWFWSSA